MNQQSEQALKKSNIRTALILGGIAISSLCIAAYGVSQTLAVGA
ncbi:MULTISPECIES: hypothetical protein [unclassified Oleiphilus]|jgi:hypothetical protein|nr:MULTISPECIES: hypothetical protein [unclassified Oleiphilus]